MLACLSASTTYASSDTSSEQLIEYLSQEKINLTLSNNQLKQDPALLQDQNNLIQRKKQNKAMLTLIQAKIVSLESFLVNQRKQQRNLSYKLKKLQQSPLGQSDGVMAQEEMSEINRLTEVNNKTIALITDNISLAAHYEQALISESHDLDLWQAKFDEQKHLDNLTQRIGILEEARSNLYKQNVVLQQTKIEDTGFNASVNHEAKILLNNQAIILIQYRITQLEQQKWLIKAEYSLIRHQDIKTIQNIIDTYKTSVEQLAIIERSLKKMIVLLKNEQGLVTDTYLKQRFIHIQKTASLRLAQITAQRQAIEADVEKKQQQLKKQLSVRQGLTEYHLDSWPTIVHELLFVPAKCYNYFKSLTLKVRDNYIWLDVWPVTFFWVSLILIIGVTAALRWVFGRFSMEKERSRLSGHLYDGLLVLLYRNIPLFSLLALFLVTFFLNRIAYVHYQLILNLILVAIVFRSLIIIARLMLLENIEDSSGHDATLYYRLKWLLLVGGWTTALMVLSHQLPLSLLLQDIFNRLFMLFMLAVSLVAWKSKDVIPYLLRNVLKTKKRYFRKIHLLKPTLMLFHY